CDGLLIKPFSEIFGGVMFSEYSLLGAGEDFEVESRDGYPASVKLVDLGDSEFGCLGRKGKSHRNPKRKGTFLHNLAHHYAFTR
ncbi:hypothetical protein KI387_000150, partial [Taxus chinensis]